MADKLVWLAAVPWLLEGFLRRRLDTIGTAPVGPGPGQGRYCDVLDNNIFVVESFPVFGCCAVSDTVTLFIRGPCAVVWFDKFRVSLTVCGAWRSSVDYAINCLQRDRVVFP